MPLGYLFKSFLSPYSSKQPQMAFPVQKSDQEWQAILSPGSGDAKQYTEDQRLTFCRTISGYS